MVVRRRDLCELPARGRRELPARGRDKLVRSAVLSHGQPTGGQRFSRKQLLGQTCLWASFAIAPPVCAMPLPLALSPDINHPPDLNAPAPPPAFWNRQFASYVQDLNDRATDFDPLPPVHQQATISLLSPASTQTTKLFSQQSQTSYRASDLDPQEPLPETVPRSLQHDLDQHDLDQHDTTIADWAKITRVSEESPTHAPSFCWRVHSDCTVAISPNWLSQVEPIADPELGILRLRRQLRPGDPELGTLQLKPLTLERSVDPELGIPILREQPLDQRPPVPRVARQPAVYLLLRADYFKTTNVFSGIDPVNDGLIRSGLTLFYAPAIGPQTYLVTSLDASLIRYANLGSMNNRIGSTTFGSLNYNELRFRAGILQRLSPRMFGEIGWSNQQLFTTKEGLRDALRGDRFFNDHSIRVELNRQDPLSPSLSLNTFYQFRASFADPSDRDRLIHSLITSLGYSLSPSLQAAIDYQIAWSHFTRQARDDVYQQLVGRLTYTLTPQSQFNVFGGFSFGNSSDSNIDFNGLIVGVGLVINLPLF
ncbi:hypothetical protein [Phormidesmis priestleyi]